MLPISEKEARPVKPRKRRQRLPINYPFEPKLRFLSGEHYIAYVFELLCIEGKARKNSNLAKLELVDQRDGTTTLLTEALTFDGEDFILNVGKKKVGENSAGTVHFVVTHFLDLIGSALTEAAQWSKRLSRIDRFTGDVLRLMKCNLTWADWIFLTRENTVSSLELSKSSISSERPQRSKKATLLETVQLLTNLTSLRIYHCYYIRPKEYFRAINSLLQSRPSKLVESYYKNIVKSNQVDLCRGIAYLHNIYPQAKFFTRINEYQMEVRIEIPKHVVCDS